MLPGQWSPANEVPHNSFFAQLTQPTLSSNRRYSQANADDRATSLIGKFRITVQQNTPRFQCVTFVPFAQSLRSVSLSNCSLDDTFFRKRHVRPFPSSYILACVPA